MRALGVDVVEQRVAFAPDAARRLVAVPGEAGRPFLTVDRDAAGAFRAAAEGFGVQLVSPEGRAIEIAERGEPAWRTERLLASQGLPTAALLQGVAVMHAAAVGIGDRAVALTAPPGAGKSSVAVHLAAGGGDLLCDDVLGMTVGDAAVLAHPGPRFANVAPDVWASLPGDARARLGDPIGESDDVHVRLAPAGGAVPLALWCFLLRDRQGAVTVEDADPVLPMLLGSAYATHVDTPGRHVRHLDLCTAIAERVRVVVVRSGPEATAAATAATVRDLLASAYCPSP